MTPKEKADELVGKFYSIFPIYGKLLAIKSAIIAVKEINNKLK